MLEKKCVCRGSIQSHSYVFFMFRSASLRSLPLDGICVALELGVVSVQFEILSLTYTSPPLAKAFVTSKLIQTPRISKDLE